MVVVSVLYPNGSGNKFDHEYYLRQHIPMLQRRLGAPLQRVAVERGLAGGAPGTPPPFLAVAHLYFQSAEAFQGAFGPQAQSILADIPNYTNTTPVIQISEVSL
ncbi:MAG TPA: EthD family reductase [Steroidobacteraceae bacterium]|jgi:uncharacterized protein (TIGR02118 family)|nr:EthD family reductase [Steroidobacteraceae bacterium]